MDFQSIALPTELSSHIKTCVFLWSGCKSKCFFAF